MRWSRLYIIVISVFIGNSLLLFYLVHNQRKQGPKERKQQVNLSDKVTVVVYDFEDFENDVIVTIQSIHAQIPDVQVLLVSEEQVYPPLLLPEIGKVKEVYLNGYPEDKVGQIESLVKTDFVLFVPDATRLKSSLRLQQAVTIFQEKQSIDCLVFSVKAENQEFEGCQGINFITKKWTLEFTREEKGSMCKTFNGKVAVLSRWNHIKSLTYPFLRPFNQALFIQAAVRNWTLKLAVDWSPFVDGRKLFLDAHNRWKYERNNKARKENMYKRFGIKKVLGIDKSVEWYGCHKNSPRCFGTVYSDIPSFIYKGRWTPPCCLRALRETARHVFDVFRKADASYWLEGGSLLGAARSGDIIPWDYDVDLGMFQHEINKIHNLKRASTGERVIDDEGYMWEKAKEGEFFRIQFSQVNHLHVDVFPFYEKNGVMTKNTWIKGHRQDTEFPAHYLKPLQEIDFVGVKASCPNNVRQFLEYKFGDGVIENPQYPNVENLKKKMGKYYRSPQESL